MDLRYFDNGWCDNIDNINNFFIFRLGRFLCWFFTFKCPCGHTTVDKLSFWGEEGWDKIRWICIVISSSYWSMSAKPKHWEWLDNDERALCKVESAIVHNYSIEWSNHVERWFSDQTNILNKYITNLQNLNI